MYNYVQVWIVRVEVFVRTLPLFLLSALVAISNGHEPKEKDGYNSPDDLHIPWERFSELSLRALDDSHRFDAARVECEPCEGPKSVAIRIRNVLVPLFGRGERPEAPEGHTVLQQVVLSWHPEHKLQEEVIAIDDQDKKNERDRAEEARQT